MNFFKKRESEVLRFVKGVVLGAKPHIKTSTSLSYCVDVNLVFPEIEIEIEYNCIRNNYKTRIWSKTIKDYLYHESEVDVETLLFLMNEYGLDVIFDKFKKDREERQHGKDTAKALVIQKYLSKIEE